MPYKRLDEVPKKTYTTSRQSFKRYKEEYKIDDKWLRHLFLSEDQSRGKSLDKSQDHRIIELYPLEKIP
jgi:hypothetical protein